jgi:hypothetical protein
MVEMDSGVKVWKKIIILKRDWVFTAQVMPIIAFILYLR